MPTMAISLKPQRIQLLGQEQAPQRVGRLTSEHLKHGGMPVRSSVISPITGRILRRRQQKITQIKLRNFPKILKRRDCLQK